MKNVMIVAGAFILAACSSVDVTTDYDREADFASYATFDWAERHNPRDGGPSIMSSQLTHRRIQSAIERELRKKGIKNTDRQPDMLVAFHSGARERIDVERYGYRYGRWGQRWGTRTRVDRYAEGTIVIDIIDARTRDLVWRGISKGVLRKGDTPEELISESVEALFKEFPPRQ